MRLRADQWMMVGVGVIGAYALYRLATAPQVQAPPLPGGTPVPPTGAPLPMLPVPTGSTALVEPTTLDLRQGRAYGGRAESGQSAADLAARVSAMGFSNVAVMISPAEAQGHVPDWTLADPTSSSRWFVGTWSGPTKTITRPPDLVAAWSTFTPHG